MPDTFSSTWHFVMWCQLGQSINRLNFKKVLPRANPTLNRIQRRCIALIRNGICSCLCFSTRLEIYRLFFAIIGSQCFLCHNVAIVIDLYRNTIRSIRSIQSEHSTSVVTTRREIYIKLIDVIPRLLTIARPSAIPFCRKSRNANAKQHSNGKENCQHLCLKLHLYHSFLIRHHIIILKAIFFSF